MIAETLVILDAQDDSAVAARKTFGEKLKEARISAGRTVAECADRLGTTEDVWYKYERGDRWPRTEERFRAVAFAVGVHPKELF